MVVNNRSSSRDIYIGIVFIWRRCLSVINPTGLRSDYYKFTSGCGMVGCHIRFQVQFRVQSAGSGTGSGVEGRGRP